MKRKKYLIEITNILMVLMILFANLPSRLLIASASSFEVEKHNIEILDFISSENPYNIYLPLIYGGTGTVTPNISPVANGDSFTTNEDVILEVIPPGVLENDIDLDLDPLKAILVTDPTNGTIELFSDGSFIYTPDLDFNGMDEFTYKVSDGRTFSNTATVTITVTPIKDNPNAVDDDYSIDSNGTLVINSPGVLENDIDVDGNNMIASLVTNVSNGSLVLLSNGSFTYSPTLGFAGSDTFTYQLITFLPTDLKTGWTDEATVTINVIPPAYGEFITVQDFGLWGPTWPEAFKLDWKYLDTFDTGTIAGLEIGMLDVGGELIVKYTAEGDQLTYQAANAYISPEKLSSASFHPSIPEGEDQDWTVIKGTSFDTWEPAMVFIQVVNTNGTTDYKTITYIGAPAYGEFISVQDFGLWGPTWPGAFKLDWKYLDSFDTATIAGIEVGMLDAGGELIVKYTAEGDQLIYQATNGYISPEKLSSASFHPSIPEGADVDWTVIKGAYFDDWEPVTVFIQVVNSNGTVDYKTIAYTGAPAYGEFITVQDFGLWGPTWPGAFKLDWKYLDSFETATIAGIEVGMLDAGGELIVKYTAGGDQLIYQATNGYISPEKLSSASFHPSIPEGADLDWTVVKGASFDAWEPVFAFIQVINTNGTFDNEAKAYYEWLGLFNQYRVTAGLDPVIQNSTYSSSIALHTNYMLLNPTQSNLYTEYVGNPGYTDEGKIAAGQSNMIKLIGGTYLTQKLSIDLWMASPSHRYNMLHPDLSQSGFSLQCDSKNCFSGLNILGSLPLSYQVQYKNLIFPADKQQDIPASRYPITWGFYMPWTSATNDNDEVRFVSATIKDHNNNSISYTKVEPYHSDGVWAYVNQVVITPSIDLLPEQTYYVDMTVSYQGQTYSRSWSFTTAP